MAASCDAGGSSEWGDGSGEGGDGGFGSGPFGVRRPLRFLAYKLGLDQRQVSELAKILDELKTERAQAEVDRRRTTSAFADAVSGEVFDEARAAEAVATGAATIATACPFCSVMLGDGVAAQPGEGAVPPRVVDVAQLLLERVRPRA